MNKHKVKNPWGLTYSEVDVMDQLCSFGCQKVVASRLGLTQSSVSTYTARCRMKMKTHSTILAAFMWRDWRRGDGRLVGA